MTSSLPMPSFDGQHWLMSIEPIQYDQTPLTEEEYQALEYFATGEMKAARALASDRARQILARLRQPIDDVFHLRHQGKEDISEVYTAMQQEMYRRRKTFWEWSPAE
jgi:hypothetical protein